MKRLLLVHWVFRLFRFGYVSLHRTRCGGRPPPHQNVAAVALLLLLPFGWNFYGPFFRYIISIDFSPVS
jgi:hypothetical protein